jgi:hypothetical protein
MTKHQWEELAEILVLAISSEKIVHEVGYLVLSQIMDYTNAYIL